MTIDGDSMEPLLSTGDRIMVDTSQRIPVPPGIFVIWDDMGSSPSASNTCPIPSRRPFRSDR
ncbi:MAG: S24 family peptidase [Stellaceae bacterium]